MGRAPCCDKANVKKGPWAPEEDATLKAYIEEHGTGGNWIALPQKIGLKRCGKSCRLRWLNYLRPNIKHGGFSEEEDRVICSLYVSIGSRWSIIAAQLPGRTDNDIKNYWNTRLKKKLLGKQRKDQIYRRKGDLLMKKGKSPSEVPSSIVVSRSIENMNSHEDPNFPQLPPVMIMPPMPYLNQESCFVSDHTSIRKLLIKLGGNFASDDHNVNHEPVNMESPHLIPIDNALIDHDLQASQQKDKNFIACGSSTPVSSSSSSILLNRQYNVLPIQEGQISGSFPSVFEEQKLDGLEFLYGDMCGSINTSGSSSSIITCGDDSLDYWGEMSATCNVMNMSNYKRSLQQGMLQDHVN